MFEFALSLWTLNWLLPSAVVGLVWVSTLTFCLLGPLTSRSITSWLCGRQTSSSTYQQSLSTRVMAYASQCPRLCAEVSVLGKRISKRLLLLLDETVMGTRGRLKSAALGSTLSLSLLFRNITEDTSQHMCLSAVLIIHWALHVDESIQLSHWGVWLSLFSSSLFKEVTDFSPAGGSIQSHQTL